jgi:dolichyl-phosphate beta-glucosyltransferase
VVIGIFLPTVYYLLSTVIILATMISIIVAAYNEEKRIIPSLFAIRDYCISKNIDNEIIVVNDGSTDNTRRVSTEKIPHIPNLKVIGYDTNMGKGYALRTGVLSSKGDFVLLTDADLSTPIEELSKLLHLIHNKVCDIAIGSRALALSQILKKQPWWRQGMGKLFNKIVKSLIIDDFDDTQCGFKLFTGESARTLFKEARINRFAYDVEILALAKRNGYRIREVPIMWVNSPQSKVNPMTDSVQMFFDLLKIRARVGKV